MKVELADLIDNLSGFSDDHLYALIGGSMEPGRMEPQSGFDLAKCGREFLKRFLEKFRDGICEKNGLRDQVRKLGILQAQKMMIPVVTTWVVARCHDAEMQVTQVVAICLAILLVRSGLDACCDGYEQHK